MRRCLFAVLPLLAIACSSGPASMPFELSAADINTSRTLAETRLAQTGDVSRLVFIKAEPLPEADASVPRRQVLLTHYRYGDDATIFTRVDLAENAVVEQTTELHYPTGLANDEIVRAKTLATDDARLATMLDLQGIELMPRPIQFAAGHPLHGHRVVSLTFRRGQETLTEPLVLVDLTTGEVKIGDAK